MWNTDQYHPHYVETKASAACDTTEESRIRRTAHAADIRYEQGVIFEGVAGVGGRPPPLCRSNGHVFSFRVDPGWSATRQLDQRPSCTICRFRTRLSS